MGINLKQFDSRLLSGGEALGISLSPLQRERLLAYLNLLILWNQTYNLTSVREPEEMLTRHLFDCMGVQKYLDGDYILDVGTGAGLPGLVLAILNESKKFVLLDSNGKKTRFLTQVCIELKLDNVEVLNMRVEKLEAENSIDIIISRAFASLEDSMKICGHLLNKQNRFMAMKAQIINHELTSLLDDFAVESVESLQIPGLSESRTLVTVHRKPLSC